MIKRVFLFRDMEFLIKLWQMETYYQAEDVYEFNSVHFMIIIIFFLLSNFLK